MELEARGWTQTELAEILGRKIPTICEIINAKRSVTPEMATGLAAAFGTTAQVWMNLQTSYDLWHAERAQGTRDVSRRARLYERAPIANMVKRGWIEGSDSIEVLEQQLRDFLGIKDLNEKPTPFRYAAREGSSPSGYRTEEPSTALQAWLLRARRLAPAVSVKPFGKESLKKVFEGLGLIRHSPEELRQVPRILAEGGIRLIIVEPLPRMKIDGGCFWLDDESPVVVLSLRHDRIDWFWHTLMHELVHIERRDGEHWDDLSEEASEGRPQVERVIEDRAADYLIAGKDFDGFVAQTRPLYSKEKIRRFAARVGVHPGIVVGQLQYKKEISWSHDRKMLVKVRDIVTNSTLTDGWGHALPAGV
jgi:HTH-type transcriptional regulator/antitoxin HigA